MTTELSDDRIPLRNCLFEGAVVGYSVGGVAVAFFEMFDYSDEINVQLGVASGFVVGVCVSVFRKVKGGGITQG